VIVKTDEYRLLFVAECGETGGNGIQVASGPLGCVGKRK